VSIDQRAVGNPAAGLYLGNADDAPCVGRLRSGGASLQQLKDEVRFEKSKEVVAADLKAEQAGGRGFGVSE
jgi:hypothetical protein